MRGTSSNDLKYENVTKEEIFWIKAKQRETLIVNYTFFTCIIIWYTEILLLGVKLLLLEKMAPIKDFDQFVFHHIKKRESAFERYKTETEYQERPHVIESFPEQLFYRNRQVTFYGILFIYVEAFCIINSLIFFQAYFW